MFSKIEPTMAFLFHRALLSKQSVTNDATATSYSINLVGNQYIPLVKFAGTYAEPGISTNIPSYSLSSNIVDRSSAVVTTIANSPINYYTITYTVTNLANNATFSANRYVYLTDTTVPTGTVGTLTNSATTGAVTIAFSALERYTTIYVYQDSGYATLINTSAVGNATTRTVSFTESRGKASRTYYIKVLDEGGYSLVGNTITLGSANQITLSKSGTAGSGIPSGTAITFSGTGSSGLDVHLVSDYSSQNYFGNFTPTGGFTNNFGSDPVVTLNDGTNYGSHYITYTGSTVSFTATTASKVSHGTILITIYYSASGSSVGPYISSFTISGYGTLAVSGAPSVFTGSGGALFTRVHYAYTAT